MSGIQSLHSHTTTSDGAMSHLELLNAAAEYNIYALAFTDHDSLPDEQTLTFLDQNRNHQTKWIFGIEMSSGLPNELGGGASSAFHICGLFVDPRNKNLLEHCTKAQEARIERMQKIVKNLQGLGFSITEADCLKASGGESVGRPHIVQALAMHSENTEVLNKLVTKMHDEAEKNEDIKRRYTFMIERGEEQYPYDLFLADDAYFKGIYVDYLYWADMDTTVKLIRDAGGVAVVAHYFTIQNKVTPDLLEQFFIEDRVDGIETTFGLEAYGTSYEATIVKTRELAQNLALKHNRLISGGSDAHTREHLEKFAHEKWYSDSTTGLAEKMIASRKVSVENSSF